MLWKPFKSHSIPLQDFQAQSWFRMMLDCIFPENDTCKTLVVELCRRFKITTFLLLFSIFYFTCIICVLTCYQKPHHDRVTMLVINKTVPFNSSMLCYFVKKRETYWVQILDKFGWTKKNWLERDLNLRPPDWRAGALPTELSSPTLAVSLFCQYLCSGAPVRSHETIYCPLARDHAQVTIQPGNRQ